MFSKRRHRKHIFHQPPPVPMQPTAVFKQVPEGYIAFIEELPGANTQGDTLEEARENLKEAVAMVLEANRILAEEELAGEDVVREAFSMPDAA